MKLDHEMVIDPDSIQWVKFYPYYEPKNEILMAACEIKFDFNEQLLTLFDVAAQRMYNFFDHKDAYYCWPKKIEWS
jgi:hypothetical protein